MSASYFGVAIRDESGRWKGVHGEDQELGLGRVRPEQGAATAPLGAALRQVNEGTGAKFFIRSAKRFNPIQHKCASETSTCTAADTSGCAADMILGDEIFRGYNPTTGILSDSPPFQNWLHVCSFHSAHGQLNASAVPAGWMGGDASIENEATS